jgi:hypothetical protein
MELFVTSRGLLEVKRVEEKGISSTVEKRARTSLCPGKRGNVVTETVTLSAVDGVLEKLRFPQAVQKLPAFEKTRIFVALATTACHLSLY